jgi:outer membrane protein OmpA-like peptidoglycan-associated protein
MTVLVMMFCVQMQSISALSAQSFSSQTGQRAAQTRTAQKLTSADTLSWWQRTTTDSLFRFGGYVGIMLNSHTGGFRSLPGIPSCCSGFPAGDGIGWTVGALARWKLFENVYGQVRVGFAQFGGDFIRDNDTIGFTAPSSGTTDVRVVTAQHTLSSSILALTIEPGIAVQPIKNLFVGVQLGIHPIFSAGYDIKEEAITPTDFVFINRSRFWNTGSGAIPGRAGILFTGILGVGYELPISRTVSVMPEARLFMPLNTFAPVIPDNASWKITSLSLGVQLLWRRSVVRPEDMRIKRDTILQRDTAFVQVFRLPRYRTELVSVTSGIERMTVSDDTILERLTIREEYRKEILAPRKETPEEKREEKPEEKRDTVLRDPPPLPDSAQSRIEARLRVIGIQPNNQRDENPTIVVEEFEGEEHFPLLTHVYFQEGRADVNESRMKLRFPAPKPPRFDEQSVPAFMLGVYADVLNIIGARLQQFPTARITLTGTVSNVQSELNNLALAQERASAVKNYLEQVWKIDPQRITVEWQLLPDNPSSLTTKDGQEENRRVEISSTDERIVAPVIKRDTIRTVTPPRLELLPSVVQGIQRVRSWRMDMVQQDSVIAVFSGTGLPTPRIVNVQAYNGNQEFSLRSNEPLTARLFVADSTGQESIGTASLTVQQRTLRSKRIRKERDTRIEQFSLILFDFDQSSINERNRAILQSTIQQRITPESRIIISAYADRQGTLEYNRSLAERRATEVRTILTSATNIAPERISIDAVGNSILLFNNTFPEGRGYSRIVQIRIETPIQ